MSARLAVVAVHGMGDTSDQYAVGLENALRKRLRGEWDRIGFVAAYYQEVLQPAERSVWEALKPGLRWDFLRRPLLYGFADAAGLETAKDRPGSVYERVQLEIARALLAAAGRVGAGAPLALVAHSLGGHVVSCYFWDASRPEPPAFGIWRDPSRLGEALGLGRSLEPAEEAFLRGRTLEVLHTTGCNIPVFVAAQEVGAPVPIRPGPTLDWFNHYDPDDVLGWPLSGLSPAYAEAVQDRRIEAGGGFWLRLAMGWNPCSHNLYWKDSRLLDAVADSLRVRLGGT